MKKKLLSLVLAGAMVASTSVSAFAATDTVTREDVTITEDQREQDINIGITGNIQDENGNTKPGTINVTVPTTATFTVTKEGQLTSADMTITNNSNEKIIVVAKGFKDPNGNENINVIKKSEFDNAGGKASNARGKVWLRLIGGEKNLGLSSEEKGKMYNNEYTTPVTEDEGYEIGKVSANKSLTLKLEGEGGTDGDATNPIRDEFKLILKVKRER